MANLRLYVWTDFARGYSAGLAFAIADDGDKARDLITANDNSHLREYLGERPQVYELDEAIAFFVTGGG